MSKETMNSLKDLSVLLPKKDEVVFVDDDSVTIDDRPVTVLDNSGKPVDVTFKEHRADDDELIHQEPKFKEHDRPTYALDNEGKYIDLSFEELEDPTPPSPWKGHVTDPNPKTKAKSKPKAPHRIPTDEMARGNFNTLEDKLKPIFDYMANKILKEAQANAKEAALFGNHVNIIDMVNEVIRPEGQPRQHWRYLLLNAFGVLPMQFNLDHLSVYTREQLAHAIKRVNGLGEFPAGTLKGMRYRHSRVDVLLDGDPSSMLRLLGKAMFSVI